MNYRNATQAIVEDIANAQKQFIDGVVESIKNLTTKAADRHPVRRSLDTTEGILLAGIQARATLADSVANTVTKVNDLPPTAVKAATRVQDLAQKLYSAEERLVKNTFAALDRYIPVNGEMVASIFQSPVQTALDLARKAVELPVTVLQKLTGRAVAAENAADEAIDTAERKVKNAAARAERAEKKASK